MKTATATIQNVHAAPTSTVLALATLVGEWRRAGEYPEAWQAEILTMSDVCEALGLSGAQARIVLGVDGINALQAVLEDRPGLAGKLV